MDHEHLVRRAIEGDKLATNAHLPLRSLASDHPLLEMNSVPPATPGCKRVIAQLGAALAGSDAHFHESVCWSSSRPRSLPGATRAVAAAKRTSY